MRYTKIIYSLAIPIVLASLVLFAVSIHFVAKLSVKSNFKEMLPQHAPSVIELGRIEKRVRSTDNLIILVGNSDWPTIRAFVDNLVEKIRTDFKGDVGRIEYDVTKVKNYYDHNKYLYIDLEDLKELYTRLKTRIDWEKLKKTPLFVQIDEEEPTFDSKDIENKYSSKTGRYQNYQDGYFTDQAADLAAIIVWPREPATNVEFSKKFIERMSETIKATPGYGPDIKFAFAGRIQKMITEYSAIIGDILTTTLLCFVLVGAVVFFYYKRVRMCILMLINVAQGVLMALAFAYFAIGHLTSQTAFLGSIIVGNGINFSLILMARYLEERRGGSPVQGALSVALARTWKPTFVAAIVTSASFGALVVTHVRGISQFGVIGGIGMILCWICTYTVLPAWLCVFERVWETKVPPHTTSTAMERFAAFIVARPWKILKVTAALTVACAALIAWYMPRSLEYDFSRLSFKAPKATNSWEEKAGDKMDEIFGQSTSPSVVVLDRTDQGMSYCDAVLAKDPGKKYVESCKTIFSFVPTEQQEKLSILADMRNLLSGSTLKFLNEEQLKEVNKFRDSFDLRELTLADVPREIIESFADIDGKEGILAFVYPKADLWNGKELEIFADIIREVKLPNGEVVRASGQPVILSDLLNAVVKEGPRVTLLSFCLVLALIWASFLRWKSVSTIQMSLITGVVWLVGCMAIMGIKLNFLNFVALPITFGIGVDYAVNIYQRYRVDGPGSISQVIGRTGGAVILCSLTTIIGYSVLLMSRSRALVSFGMVALLGEVTCLSAALISLPAFIIWREKREAAKQKWNP
ncbi:MAG: MMPL family transporter [Pseudomonadota bacterium]